MRANELTLHYFAYGHNTDSSEFKRRCPSAEYVGVGKLNNFYLDFRKYANIVSDESKKVYGVVWNITHKDLLALDQDEEYHKHYNRIPVNIYTKKGTVACTTYIMDPDFNPAKTVKKDYIQKLVIGYKEHHIPLEQIKQALKKDS